jgi:hypothetical protein
MKEIKKLLTPYDTEYTKKRYGSDTDGGYVLLEEIVNSSKRVYSLGIHNEFAIDIQLANLGKKVFQYDCNFCSTPQSENLKFKQLYIDHISLMEELNLTGGIENDKNILLMDIEGGEYDVIINSPSELLNSFSLISLELHFLTRETKLESLLKKINETHILTHIHANNWVLSQDHQNYINGPGIVDEVPDLLELTYIKKSKVTKKSIMLSKSPTIYDKKNAPNLDDLELSWWLNQK